jgi:hypothetical protein
MKPLWNFDFREFRPTAALIFRIVDFQWIRSLPGRVLKDTDEPAIPSDGEGADTFFW